MPFVRIYHENFRGRAKHTYGPDQTFPQPVSYQFGNSAQPPLVNHSPSPSGMRLEVQDVPTGGATQGQTVSYGVFVNPISLKDGDRIKLFAKFKSVSGPHAPYDTSNPNPPPGTDSVWAVAIQLRAGTAADDGNGQRSRISTTLLHNLRDTSTASWSSLGLTPARLNSPQNNVNKQWLSAADYDEIFVKQKGFALEMVVDLPQSVGGFPVVSCGLLLGGRRVTEFKNFNHHQARPSIDFVTAGAAVVIDNADGPNQKASVVVSQFDILKWVP